MRRLLKQLLTERPPEDDEPSASFDDLLVRELDAPTVIDLESDIDPSRDFGRFPLDEAESAIEEGDRLRAELLPGPAISRSAGAAISRSAGAGIDRSEGVGIDRSAGAGQLESGLVDSGFAEPKPLFERTSNPPLPTLDQNPMPGQTIRPAVGQPMREGHGGPAIEVDAVPGQAHPGAATPPGNALAPSSFDASSEARRLDPPTPAIPPVPGFQQTDFWDRYDEAAAAANLFSVPPAAITVIIGPLDVAIGVAQRCRAGHWVSECDVYVLTDRAEIAEEPSWTPLRRPSDVVAVLENGESDFPLIVLDIQRELPAWVRPLVVRLRDSGVGLVHYVLDDDPSDEDLATWHGELGRPSVLDLAAYVAPDRVLQLLDKGEPIASVAGMPISTDLLLALRLGANR